ncbi:MAG: ADP-ribosylglycohydrolase family protein [Gemmatimonadales bacterium]|nr:ADP-ribosylglycohydrolase family protein [Gemmatimonadales bacterium]
MIGAIGGDIIGSPYEFNPIKTTDFPLFSSESKFTDDTVLTLATAFTLMTDGDYSENYRIFGRLYPLAGYGLRFKEWLTGDDPRPYNSWGNGSAMRVSPVGFGLNDEKDVLQEAERSAMVTHDHPEGVKGAQATALAIFLARKGADAETIRKELTGRFAYDLDRTVAEIRPDYSFTESCQETVPQALVCALEADDWEDAVRLSVSLGGDADTLACIAGGVAEALGGQVPEDAARRIKEILPEDLLEILEDFPITF